MVFQKPNPFPKSIYDNVAYGPRVTGMKVSSMDDVVEEALTRAALWDEVKDKLKQSAYGLSGGQQQRLCIARTIAVEPEVILMDEPCSALDPIATSRIEDLMTELRRDYTIIIVTHNMQQAARVADRTAFFTALADETHGRPHRAARGVRRHHEDLHQPDRQAHRGLHRRPLRLETRWPLRELAPDGGGRGGQTLADVLDRQLGLEIDDGQRGRRLTRNLEWDGHGTHPAHDLAVARGVTQLSGVRHFLSRGVIRQQRAQVTLIQLHLDGDAICAGRDGVTRSRLVGDGGSLVERLQRSAG